MNKYTIRKTREEDCPAVMRMYDHSRSLMRAAGNSSQWVGYPTEADLREDIRRGASYVLCLEGRPVGTFALVEGVEPTYGVIVHGRWIDTVTPYVTLHRLAKADGVRGVAEAAFAFAKERCSHIRIDTHESNRAMRSIADRQGFVYCGIVFMDDGGERVAYEWWRYDGVPASLKEYVESEILPRHEHYDTAHQPDHIRRVIARGMVLGERLKVKGETTKTSHLSPLTYAACAMHDIGICEGREEHHLASGRIIRADAALRQWFTEEEIELVAQAAEDHRASAKTAPRSLLGCIVAEADRDVEPETIVRRTVEYGLSHYPELDREGHWRRTLEHLHEKYAEGGYIKLWLEDSPNAEPLSELRALIRDEQRLRPLFDQFYYRNK